MRVVQLVKDFTTDHGHSEVTFYLSMVEEEKQTYEGLTQHLKYAFSLGSDSSFIVEFFSQTQKAKKLKLTMP